MRIAITADLHWGHNKRGDEATRGLVELLAAQPPDVLLLGGDQGTEDHFGECLELFQALGCPKALVPGNHDIWVAADDPRGDSLHVYQQHLPSLCAAHGFHYLDHAPLILPQDGLAIAGSINWYDYSWSLENLQRETSDWEWRLRTKSFTRGRHNDGRFVRWSLDDAGFTTLVVDALRQQVDAALAKVAKVLVLTHHPALHGLNFPRAARRAAWMTFSGMRCQEMPDLKARSVREQRALRASFPDIRTASGRVSSMACPPSTSAAITISSACY